MSVRALPGTAPAQGGAVEVVGEVRKATVCRLTVLADRGVRVDLPKPTSCAKGAFRARVGFGPNAKAVPVVVELGLFAGSSAPGRFYVVVASKPAHPAILSVRAYPWELPASGGWADVVGKVRNAGTCHLVALDWAHPDLPRKRCSDGAFSEHLWFARNASHVAEPEAFELVASGRGSAVGKFFVRLAAAPLPPPAPSTTLPATTTTVPPAQGAPPPVLPLTPPPGPVTTTTTTAPPSTTTTEPPSSTTTTAPPSTTTTEPSTTTTTTTTAPSLSSTATEMSYNWSGYAIQPPSATSFNAASGRFVVPTITSPANCNDMVSTWVGVDGFNDSYLLQAGVSEANCNNSQQDYPWVEVITPTDVQPASFIWAWDTGQPASVSPGDQVSVSIAEVASGTWDVALTDLATGGAWTGSFQWAGPGQSAEWVVEDPDQPGNSACTYQPAGLNLCPLPDFGSVAFSDLGAAPGGSTGSWTGTYIDGPMGQSAPGPLATNGTFSVAYGPPVAGPMENASMARTVATPF